MVQIRVLGISVLKVRPRSDVSLIFKCIQDARFNPLREDEPRVPFLPVEIVGEPFV